MADEFEIREVSGEFGLMDSVRLLFREYEAEANIDLCFQDFEEELANLPGKYARPTGRLFMAFSGDRPAGVIAFRPLGDSVCEMKRLYVRPEFRSKGLGIRLCQTLIEASVDEGYRSMRLDTLSKMESAIRLYQSLGFERCQPYYDNPLEGVVYMALDLDNR